MTNKPLFDQSANTVSVILGVIYILLSIDLVLCRQRVQKTIREYLILSQHAPSDPLSAYTLADIVEAKGTLQDNRYSS